MKLLIISSAPVIVINNKSYLYAPYEKEMQLWSKHVCEIQFCCPVWYEDKTLLITPITFPIVPTIVLQEFDIKTFLSTLKAIPKVFKISIQLFKAFKEADYIHLRCPGNMGLIAAFVQLFYPKKKKTVKYAGNWDPKSSQPFTYRLQKWILSNPFLTRNTQVLVYGDWEGSSKNVRSFFTATYSESEIQNSEFRIQDKLSLRVALRTHEIPFKFLFVGTLSPGKQPLFAIQLVEELYKKGKNVSLDLYGEGVLRQDLESYIIQNNLAHIVALKGNQTKEVVLKAYQTSHFLILPSKSEGWPKVVAEAMFWGCFPIATAVSCVPFMLDYGKRGIVLKEDLTADVLQLEAVFINPEVYDHVVLEAMKWSRQFTTDVFESEIKKLLLT
ncbi:glycosyltransferase [Flavobacterium cucumis]|uniref:Glycosyltransferase involved in cell wall bisynthesis n=1 Tax=Flavobacterium cucumis TaxID=416016 RepID=A0A1M7ZWM1_9FLAO|nr:glycosyltransferase [Flavobacterium cucumis]SHO73203.1 Glycosyltransferase involved in cell wall bisynthesis [Flavobacterium cucumis]